jgi:hypothetical protein
VHFKFGVQETITITSQQENLSHRVIQHLAFAFCQKIQFTAKLFLESTLATDIQVLAVTGGFQATCMVQGFYP